MESNIIQLAPTPTFDDWWALFPAEIRKGKKKCRQKWDAITGDGLDTKSLDKDSGVYVPMFHQATPEAITAGTKAWIARLPLNADYTIKDIQYEKRAQQFLNQGLWEDFL